MQGHQVRQNLSVQERGGRGGGRLRRDGGIAGAISCDVALVLVVDRSSVVVHGSLSLQSLQVLEGAEEVREQLLVILLLFLLRNERTPRGKAQGVAVGILRPPHAYGGSMQHAPCTALEWSASTAQGSAAV